ncbi:response regulator [Shewanella sp. A22]
MDNSNNLQSFKYFLLSKDFNKTLKASVGGLSLILILSLYFFCEKTISDTRVRLHTYANQAAELIKNRNKAFSEGLVFLKSTPAMTELAASSTEDVYENILIQRLTETFEAYMLSLSNVYQIRLIKANANGSEIIRVERINGDIQIATKDLLQKKGDRDYFHNTILLNDGEIFTSTIEPNIENKKVEIPIRMTRRYSTPVYMSDGQVYGIIVINVEEDTLLDTISRLPTFDEVIYINNDKSKIILSNNKDDVRNSFLLDGYRFVDIFNISSSTLINLIYSDLNVIERDNYKLIDVSVNITPDIFSQSAGVLTVHATQTTNKIYVTVLFILLKVFLCTFLLSIVGMFFVYYSWVNNERNIIANRINKELEEQKEKDDMFESLTELSPEAMVISDTKGQIILVNSQTEKLYGYDRTELVGKNISVLVPVSVAPKHDQYVDQYVRNPVVRPMGASKELYSRHSDGSSFPVEVSLSPVQLANRLVIASSIRNVAERKKIESTLKKAINEAKTANEAKSTFLANMSHEIRTPLNAVIGLTYLLKDEHLSSSQLDLVTKIQLAGRSLLGIVNDVLDISKIEANKVKVINAPCNIQTLLEEVSGVFSGQAQNKGLSLHLEIDSKISVWVDTDKKLLQQIITNLIGNAIKFTLNGSVSLRAKLIESSILPSSKQLIRFEVQDTGIGISNAIQERIFQPFNQADDGANRRFEGTGLGLAIVTSLSQLLGGEVFVESTMGVGSCFSFEVPFSAADFDKDIVNDSTVDILKIWVIETTSELSQLAKSLGWNTFIASKNGVLTEEYQQKLINKIELPDFVLIESDLASDESLALFDKLVNKNEWQNIPLIATISPQNVAYVKTVDSKNIIEAYATKPVSASTLFTIVNDTVSSLTGNVQKVLESTRMENIKAKWLPNVKILVVDDSEMNLEVVQRILSKNGALVTTANSGELAIKYISNGLDEYDIVLMDVHMPVMDGLETVAYIRQQLGLRQLPIIALTAGTTDDEKKNAMSAGMNDFLTKPIEPTRLIVCIRKLIENYRNDAVKIDNYEFLQSDLPVDTNEWPQITGIVSSSDLFQGDISLFEFALKRLFKEHHQFEEIDLDNLMLETEEQRLVLASLIHKLRGSAGMVGAKELYDVSSQAEMLLRKDYTNFDASMIKIMLALFSSLKANCQSFLVERERAKQAEIKVESSNAQSISREGLAKLLDMLESNNLDAITFFHNESAGLAMLIEHDDFKAVKEHIENLNYKQAYKILNVYLAD